MNIVSEVRYIKHTRAVSYTMSNGFPLSVDTYLYQDKEGHNRYVQHLEGGSTVIFTDGSFVSLGRNPNVPLSGTLGVGGWSFGAISSESKGKSQSYQALFSGMTFAAGSGIMELYSIKEALQWASENAADGPVSIFSDSNSFLSKMIKSVQTYDAIGVDRSVNKRLMDRRVKPESISEYNDIMNGYNIMAALSEKSLFKYITSLLLACERPVRFCWVQRCSNPYARKVDNYSKAARVHLQQAVLSTLGLETRTK